MTKKAGSAELSGASDPDQSHLITALERQRLEIAGEIHDDLMPYLFAASAALAAHQRNQPTSDSQGHLSDAVNWLDQSRQIARQILAGLNVPGSVRNNPLVAARDFIEMVVAIPNRDPIPELRWTNLQAADSLDWDPSRAAAVYRIVTELVRNALRHAKASHVRIDATAAAESLSISIADDGVGMPVQTPGPAKSYGLVLAFQRADWIGAELRQIAVEQGTRFELQVDRMTAIKSLD